MKTIRPNSGDPIILEAWKVHQLVCCDCGRADKFLFSFWHLGKAVDQPNAIRLALWADKKATAKERKRMKEKA